MLTSCQSPGGCGRCQWRRIDYYQRFGVRATFGLTLDDVLFYLDDEVTVTFAKEGFPGWSAAKTIWGNREQLVTITANGSKFKEWVTSTYGLGLDGDSVRNMARKCKEEGKIPEELSAVVAAIISKTL